LYMWGLFSCANCPLLELEHGLQQSNKPRRHRSQCYGKKYTRALRTSQIRKEGSVSRTGSIILRAPSVMGTVHEIILKPDLSRFCVCFCVEESMPLFSLLGTPIHEPPLTNKITSLRPSRRVNAKPTELNVVAALGSWLSW